MKGDWVVDFAVPLGLSAAGLITIAVAIGKDRAEPGGVRAEGAMPADYRHATGRDAEVLAMEERARVRYCRAIGGAPLGAEGAHKRCWLGSCDPISNASGAPCGLREVVCDDVEDEHQCGLMAGQASP